MQMKQFALHLSLALVMTLTLTLTASANGPQPLPPTWAPPPPTDQALVDQLKQVTEGKMHISYHTETGKVRFVGTDAEHPIPRPGALAADAQPEQIARAFLGAYGELFGLTDQAKELTVMRAKAAGSGRSFVRFHQVSQGIPVFGGELIVQMDANKNVMSANGEMLPTPKVNVVPAITAKTAQQQAAEAVAKSNGLSVEALTVTEPELWIYNPILLGGPGPRFTTLAWRMEVKAGELDPVKELVLVDAHSGIVTLHFNQIETAKYRKIYDNQNNAGYGLPGRGPVRVEGQGATGITDVDKAYDYAGDVYDFYLKYHGRDSIDGAGMQLISTVRYCEPGETCPFPNAFWNGSQMVYGQGYSSADDVVGHEMTHGMTDHESHLFYYMQSGAINEALSDIWGEFIDQTNGKGNDSSSVRWLMGEDMSGGAIRSMSNPPTYGDPDRMSSYNYVCGTSDNGGVHTNSGVANKAAYLMTDGGSFNGYTISGIGITKTAWIFYEAQSNLMTSASDYEDLYNVVQQACADLIDQAAPTTVQTVTSGDLIRYTANYTVHLPIIMKKYRQTGITANNCQQVKNALDAVEMAEQPWCSATHAPICPTGYTPSNIFYDDLENPNSGRWTKAATVGNNAWSYPQNPNPLSRYGFDATYATSGQYNFYGYDQPATADYHIRMNTSVALPSGGTPYLHFNHAYAFEGDFDGGVVEYSTNGGSTWSDADSLFADNGYDGTIWNYSGSTNPLRGRRAFVWGSYGYTSSRLNLGALAGQNVRFRFRIGTDSTGDYWGWFIDDVRIYTCVLPPPPAAPVLNSISNSDNDGNYGVTWSAVSGATSYTLQEDDNVGFSSPTTRYTGSGVSWSASNQPNGTYYYRVQASNSGGSSGWSNVQSTTVNVLPPDAPVLNSISNPDGDGNYDVTWNVVSRASSYTLQEDDNAGFSSPTTQYAGSATSWSASNHVTGTYYYRAQASNAGGASGWSNIQLVTITVAGPPSWTTIITEDFEGSFPGTTWIVDDADGPTNGEYYWAKRNCRPYAGSYSGWGVGGGANGAALSCGSTYPIRNDSLMSYGPFSLVGATAGDLSFKLWLNTESGYDFVCRSASIDGANFYGTCTSGNTSGWIDRVLDLSDVYTLGDLMGQPNVWIMLEFYSDSSNVYTEGAYVDNIVLRKCTASTCPAMGSTVSYSGNGLVVEFPRMITLPR